MSRSEAMKRYWSIIKEVSDRTGKSVREVRHEFKGTVFPKTDRTHYVTKPYQYEAHAKGKYITVASDRPLTEDEIRQEADDGFAGNEEDYGEEGHIAFSDIRVGKSYLDINHIPRTKEEEEEESRDIEEPEYRFY